jgi:hypothetical protein
VLQKVGMCYFRPAIYVPVRYGGEFPYRRVAHIPTTPHHPNDLADLEKVGAAMQVLRVKHRLF